MVNNRTDINSVLSQMRQVRNQMQQANPMQAATQVNDVSKTQSIQRSDSVNSMDASARLQSLVDKVQALDTAQTQQAVQPANFPNATPATSAPDFSEMFKNAVDGVNANQMKAGELATKFEKGDPSVDLPEVMIALQKSSVSFQAMTQVRNKLVEAYKDIMNMPV